jgi:hypothetical protein
MAKFDFEAWASKISIDDQISKVMVIELLCKEDATNPEALFRLNDNDLMERCTTLSYSNTEPLAGNG